MSNFTTSRLGQTNGAGSSNALFLQLFGGEVLSAFERKCVMMPLHMVRTIPQGKSASFPTTAKPTAAYHTAGNELTGAAINHAERVIFIDDPLIAHVYVAQIDELKNHWDVRGEYARLLGEQLAITADQQLLQTTVLAARASATATGGNAGTVLTNATAGTVGADLATSIFNAAQNMDQKDVPEGDRFVAVKPAQYYLLGQTTALLDKDWGGMGSISEGVIKQIAGIGIVKTNNLPTTDLSAGSTTGQNNTYLANFSTTVAVAFHKSAVGTVKLMDLATSADWIPQNQSTLLLAKYAMGHGILRPESAVEIKTA
jgi:hypothetical protein